MPSVFAYAALVAWPIVVFSLCRTLPPTKAFLASIIGGYLLLPYGVGFDLPILVALDKNSIPVLSFVVAHFLFRPAPTRPIPGAANDLNIPVDTSSPTPRTGTTKWRSSRRGRDSKVELLLLSLIFVGPVLTVYQNQEPIIHGPTILPGLTYYDLFGIIQTCAVSIFPYLISRHLFRDLSDHKTLLFALVLSALLYTVLALIEIRLSPQLSRLIYGFLAQDFVQAVRDGGYRPVVFMQHGLWLAIFFCVALAAAFALWRQVHVAKWFFAGVWIFLILALSRSLGALALALVAAPIVLFAKPRTQVAIAGMLALVIVLYPALRGAGLVPVESLASWAETVSTEREQSLTFRFDNEDQLLARANLKPLTGWGTWGRGRIYNERGEEVSVTDGIWIIFVTDSGWLGYLANFGLLTLPLILLAVRRKSAVVTPATAGLSIALSLNLVDMIPNATLTPITWMIAGALMGALRSEPVVDDQQAAAKQPGGRRQLAYSRGR